MARSGTIPNSRVAQNKYPFAGLLQTGAGVKYESSANVAGCVKCHTDPYLKHGYIYGTVDGDTKTDFYDLQGLPPRQWRGRALRVAVAGQRP